MLVNYFIGLLLGLMIMPQTLSIYSKFDGKEDGSAIFMRDLRTPFTGMRGKREEGQIAKVMFPYRKENRLIYVGNCSY